MNIFLLEDDVDVAGSMIAAFELRGHSVFWTTTVSDARRVIENRTKHGQGDPDLQLGILDLNVPDGLGHDLLPLNFPAVMYSGLPDDAERGLRAKGITDVRCFSKGDPFALIDYIEEVGTK